MNRRVPNGTHGGVRGRKSPLETFSYSIPSFHRWHSRKVNPYCGAANCDLHKQHFWGGKNDRIKRQVVNQHHIPAVNTALCYHFYESGIPLIAASMMSASMTSFLFCSPIVRASVMTLSISRGIPLL